MNVRTGASRKTIIYVLAAFLVRLAEHIVPLIIKYGSFREAIARLADEIVWPHFWVIFFGLLSFFLSIAR